MIYPTVSHKTLQQLFKHPDFYDKDGHIRHRLISFQGNYIDHNSPSAWPLQCMLSGVVREHFWLYCDLDEMT